MDITVTLIGQMATFLLLVLFTMKFVWPPLVKALEARRARIAEGLDAADRAQRALAEAERRSAETLAAAEAEASRIVEAARERGAALEARAAERAKAESERLLAAGKARLAGEERAAAERLRGQTAALALDIAAKILDAEIDPARHRALLDRAGAMLR